MKNNKFNSNKFSGRQQNTRSNKKTSRSKYPSKSNSSKRMPDDKTGRSVDTDITNHPAWYTRIPGLAEFIGRIPINVISNLPLPLSLQTHVGNGIYSPDDNTFIQPNIVTYYKDLVSPLSYVGTDARSLAMRQFSQEFFTKMRRENVSNMPYDPEAVTLMILNMACGYGIVNLAQRTYGMLNYFNSLNRAFPLYLAKAMNLDYEDFRNKMPEFQVRLNMLIHRFDAMRLPRGIDLIEKIATQYSNYYIDTTDTRDTLYIPLPGDHGLLLNDQLGFLNYPVWGSSGIDDKIVRFFPSGNVEWTSNQDKRITVDKFMRYIETFVDNILRSQDFGRIQGDLERAFGSNGYYTLEPMPVDYSCPPVNDEMVLMQLHNADIIASSCWASNSNNFGRSIYFGINSSTGLACGSWCYGQPSWTDSNGVAFMKKYQSLDVVPSSDTTHGTWPTVVPAGLNDRYMCMNPEQISADNVIEFSRNKGPWGVDTISSFAVWLPLSDTQRKLFSDLGKTVTGTDLLYYYCNSNNVFNAQHIGYLVSIGASTLYDNYSGSGVFTTSSVDFRNYFQNNTNLSANLIPDSIRSIVRYLPYQIIRAYYSATADSTATRALDSIQEEVLTFAPVVQPVTESYLNMLGLNCWMSLLTM